MSDLSFDQQMQLQLTNAFILLGGVVVGALVPFATSIINHRNSKKIESIKLHDIDKIEAHKFLFTFSRQLKNSCFPLAEEKVGNFKGIMDKYYTNKIFPNLVYYNKYLLDILENMESVYICSITAELSFEVDYKKYIEEHLYKDAEKLEKEIMKVIKSWNN